MTRDELDRKLRDTIIKALLPPHATVDELCKKIKKIVRESLPQRYPMRDLKSTHRNDLIDEIENIFK